MTEETADRLTPLTAALASVAAVLAAADHAADHDSLELMAAIDRVRAIVDLLERLIVETPEALISDNLVATLIQQLQPATTALPQAATDPCGGGHRADHRYGEPAGRGGALAGVAST